MAIHDKTLITHDDPWQHVIKHYTWYVMIRDNSNSTVIKWPRLEHHLGSLIAKKVQFKNSSSSSINEPWFTSFHIYVALPWGRYNLILGCLMMLKICDMSLSSDLQAPQIPTFCTPHPMPRQTANQLMSWQLRLKKMVGYYDPVKITGANVRIQFLSYRSGWLRSKQPQFQINR